MLKSHSKKFEQKKKPEKKSKSGKKYGLGRLIAGAALFVAYAAVYTKIEEHIRYLISDNLIERR